MSYSVDETKRAWLQVGERVADLVRPLPAGTSVDLTVYVPPRLVPAWERHPSDETEPDSNQLAGATVEQPSP